MSQATAHRGPIHLGEILALALPATASAVIHHAYRPLDQFFVQDLGKEAQGGLGACTFVLIFVYASFVLVSHGAAPIIGRCTGAGDHQQRREVLGQALFSCGFVALGLFFAGLLTVSFIPPLLGLQGLAASHAESYLRWIFLTGGALVVAPLVDGAFHAMGNTRLPMVLQGLGLGLNALLNPLLIYSAGLGTMGAALATTLSQTLVVGIGLVWLIRATALRRQDVTPGPHVRRLLALGAPVAASTGAYAAVYWAMLRTSITPLGDDVIAGLGIGFSAL